MTPQPTPSPSGVRASGISAPSPADREACEAADLETSAPEVRSSRARRRRTVLVAALGVGAVFVGLSIVLALRLDTPSTYRGTALLGKPVPEVELTTFEGDTLALHRMRGQAVLINFFNSWCVPCREEEPALQAFYAEHGAEPDVEMIGIVRDDTESAVRDWVDERGTPWPVAMDPGAQAAVDFATTGQPETYAISPQGVVVGRHLGRATVDDLEALLAAARGSGDVVERGEHS